MDTSEFEKSRRAEGFSDFELQSLPNTYATTPHVHPFDVAAFVTKGEITLTCQGQAQTYRPGEIFTMAQGTQHFERVGADGVEYFAGKRR
jgi:mannose-6-phosphate isomerase-like protein (cupin superfamily)